MKREWEFEIREEKFYIDGKWSPLLCGEIHYFRIPKEYWGVVLDRLVEAGCNAVAYYVPWLVHEYKEGKFDFRGEVCPENDLHTWIEMTMERGLLAYFRPGPYVYAETTDLGIPRWFTEKYGDARVKRYKDGVYQDTDFANCVAHNHPDFLAAVERWYEVVCREVEKYQAPDGNIVMFQLCNEIPGDDHDDENPVTLGIGRADGMWPSYLSRTYGTVEELNRRYHTEFAALEWVRPHMLREADGEAFDQEHLNYYYGTYFPEYFRRLEKMVRDSGIRVLLTHNAYNPRAVSLHYQNKVQNPWLVIGLDCYYSLSGRLGIKDATYYCEFGAEYGRRFLGNVPWVIEQECGYWHDYPEVYGPELYIWNIWTMACGYQGMNMYLFSGGINLPGMGFFGTEHNWQAPVDYKGVPAETYEYIKRSLADIRGNMEVFLGDMCYDIGFGIKHAPGLIWKPVARAGNDAYFVLKEAGFTPHIYDYEAMNAESLRECPAMWIVSDEYMDEEIQRNLAEYVHGGGRLILNGRVPDRTENGVPCTVLAEELGVRVERTPFSDEDQQKLVMGDTEYFIGKRIQKIENLKLQVAASDKNGKPAVLYGAVGEGMVMILPFALEMLFHGMAKAVRGLLGELGVTPIVENAGRLRVVPKESGAFVVMNLHPVHVNEHIMCRSEGKRRAWEIEMEPHSFCIIS